MTTTLLRSGKSLRSGLIAALPLILATVLPISGASAADLKHYDFGYTELLGASAGGLVPGR